MEVVGINVKTSEMDPFFVRFVDVFRCHRLFFMKGAQNLWSSPTVVFGNKNP